MSETEIEGGAGDDLITYIDLGDRTLEIDNRGPVQQRRVHPKAQRSVGVTPQVRQELEQRIEQEIQPLVEVERAKAEADPYENLPEVEDWEDVAAREQEAAEQLQAANEARAEDEGVAANPPEPSGEETPPPAEEPNATDAAKAYATEKGIDLSQVTGTGSGGTITKPDVEAYEAAQAGS